MSTNNDDISKHYPLRDAEPEKLAEELEARKHDAVTAVEAVNRALLNDEVPLQEATAEEIEDVGIALRALSNTLHVRADR